MAGIRDITPPVRYAPAERRAARENLAKSRFFLVLGLGLQPEYKQNPIPPIICTCPQPHALLKVVRLESEERHRSRDLDGRVCIELKGRQSPKARIGAANRIASAIGALFTFVHHTNWQGIVPYQIRKKSQKRASSA
jgi:hypothetical protein